jgi:hypothetical protein
MTDDRLISAVNVFTEMVIDLTDDQLERDWAWGSYDSEGVRFAFFRLYEDLRDLGGRILQERIAAGVPQTEAQHYLSRYHAAYLDLQAVLLGVNSEQAENPAAEGEWSLRRTVAHIVGADLGFYVAIKFALDRAPDHLVEITDETWLEIAGIEEHKLDAIMAGPMDGLQAFHRDVNARILSDFTNISPSELQMPSKYWEKEPLRLSFRLGRFDSHLRQHTVQIEKTMASLGMQPNESKRLLRLIIGALAEVEGALLGAPEHFRREADHLADKVSTRTEEIRPLLD